MPSSPSEQVSPGEELTSFYLFTDEYWDEGADARTASLPLISGGPWKVVSIIGIYLIFVVYAAPRFMASREPFKIKKLMIIYSCVLSIGNALGFLLGFTAATFGYDAFTCKKANSNINSIESFQDFVYVYGGWMYFFSKLIDLIDTVIFALRKSQRQISGLHLFHHSLMPIASWAGVKYVPGGNIVLVPLINSFIHSIMYAYYGFTAAGHKVWWKQYLTLAQVLQFVIFVAHGVYSAIQPTCSHPMIWNIAELFYASLFFYLFAKFYRRTYLTSKVSSLHANCIQSDNSVQTLARKSQNELNNNVKFKKFI